MQSALRDIVPGLYQFRENSYIVSRFREGDRLREREGRERLRENVCV